MDEITLEAKSIVNKKLFDGTVESINEIPNEEKTTFTIKGEDGSIRKWVLIPAENIKVNIKLDKASPK